uniref:Uncharacterized protein n=2 Tax=Candidatus Kentrum sp. FM TaxID=2126340 RepID=A0A450TYJ5_9GAMM|nr:MAG: hypothetical protein BECKFM1743C_GA0114222_108004 [Candidatus Kentron sp. FM]VFK23399.1 MAG: hypothetical protein BECKFM1743B_GA0114221_109224 [Candidatus Kentron sp. FM]
MIEVITDRQLYLVQREKSIEGGKCKSRRLLLDSGLMADRWDYPSEIDVDGRMFGGEHLGSPLRSPRT